MKIFYKNIKGESVPTECLHSPYDLIYPSERGETKKILNIVFIICVLFLFVAKFKIALVLACVGAGAYMCILKMWGERTVPIEDINTLLTLKERKEVALAVTVMDAGILKAASSSLLNKDLAQLCKEINKKIKLLEAKKIEEMLTEFKNKTIVSNNIRETK